MGRFGRALFRVHGCEGPQPSKSGRAGVVIFPDKRPDPRPDEVGNQQPREDAAHDIGKMMNIQIESGPANRDRDEKYPAPIVASRKKWYAEKRGSSSRMPGRKGVVFIVK